MFRQHLNEQNATQWLIDGDIHESWRNAFYTDKANLKFYDMAFDKILNVVKVQPNSKFLDAGCGPCVNSIRLAQLGYRVEAIDLSPAAVRMGIEDIRAAGLESHIRVKQGDLLNMPYPDESFDFVLCWGVLMHIPNLERAIRELSRILRSDGFLIMCEGNKNSIDTVLARLLARFLRHGKTKVKPTPAGVEFWTRNEADVRFSRHGNIKHLTKLCAEYDLTVKWHHACQFSEMYRKKSPGY